MMDQDPFMDAFGVSATIEGEAEAVPVIFMARNVNSGERGFDYDLTASQLKIEIREQDKAKFVKGKTIELNGSTFTIYRKPVRNMSSLEWEVELEP